MPEIVNVWFGWERFSRDVKWVSAKAVADDWSVSDASDDVLVHTGDPLDWHFERSRRRTYEPLQVASGLFREVAALEASREAICDFVLEYGPLTFGELYVPLDHHRKLPRPPRGVLLGAWKSRRDLAQQREASDWVFKWHQAGAVQGDSLAFWSKLIREMKTLVSIWDAICHRDEEQLKRHVLLETKKDGTFVSLLDDDRKAVDGPRRFADKDLSGLALAQAAESCLTSALSTHLNAGVSLTMYPPESNHRGQLALVPDTLYDAIWLQFVLAVNGSKKFGACEICGKPFEISPQVARTNRKLCSPACKAKAHRRRHGQALQLARQGRTAKQIAKQVGSQVSTVEKWLEEAKRGE
jgi:hypothetical protein